MQFVLSHPDLNAVFVRQTGEALREAGWPCCAVTHYVDRPDVWWRQLASGLGRLAGVDLDREFRRRLLQSSPWTAIDAFPAWELARIAALRAGLDPRVADLLFERGIRSLEGRTIRALDASTTHVYCYEYSARQTFEAATRLGIRKIYEVPSPEYDFVERLLADEMRAFPELRTAATPYFERVKAARLERRRGEWQAADLIVINSTFTLKTFEQAGQDVSKVVVVPLGPRILCGAPPAANRRIGRFDSSGPGRFRSARAPIIS